jgi:hypothetical protein
MKHTFKVGDTVRIVKCSRDSARHLGKVGKIVSLLNSGEYGDYKVDWNNGMDRCDATKVELIKPSRKKPVKRVKKHRTIEQVREGDVIVNDHGEEKVLAVCGQLVFMSTSYNFNIYESTLTFTQLKKDGYTIKGETPPPTIDIEGKAYDVEKVKRLLKYYKIKGRGGV